MIHWSDDDRRGLFVRVDDDNGATFLSCDRLTLLGTPYMYAHAVHTYRMVDTMATVRGTTVIRYIDLNGDRQVIPATDDRVILDGVELSAGLEDEPDGIVPPGMLWLADDHRFIAERVSVFAAGEWVKVP